MENYQWPRCTVRIQRPKDQMQMCDCEQERHQRSKKEREVGSGRWEARMLYRVDEGEEGEEG